MFKQIGHKSELEEIERKISVSKMSGRQFSKEQRIDNSASAEEKSVEFFFAFPEKGRRIIFEIRDGKRHSAMVGDRLDVWQTCENPVSFPCADDDTDGRAFLFHISIPFRLY